MDYFLGKERNKCLKCISKDFKISYLREENIEEKRRHCYKHLNYYPFNCQFVLKTTESQDIKTCDQKFFSFTSLTYHLRFQHKLIDSINNFYLNNRMSPYFDCLNIAQIDGMIENCLISKDLLSLNNSMKSARNSSYTQFSSTSFGQTSNNSNNINTIPSIAYNLESIIESPESRKMSGI